MSGTDLGYAATRLRGRLWFLEVGSYQPSLSPMQCLGLTYTLCTSGTDVDLYAPPMQCPVPLT
eukprot:1372005-Rhodomonas_salina.6